MAAVNSSWLIGGVSAYIINRPYLSAHTDKHVVMCQVHHLLHALQPIVLLTSAVYGVYAHAQSEPLPAPKARKTALKTKLGEETGNEKQGADLFEDRDSGKASEDEDEEEIKQLQKEGLAQKGGWFGYIKSMSAFLPYVFPRNNPSTQLWLAAMMSGMCIDRVVNVLIPRQLSIMTEALNRSWGTGYVPVQEIAIYILLQFPLSTGLFILRNMAVTRVTQQAFRQLNVAAVSHVMDLSMDYHTSKSTGKVTRAIEQGSDLSGMVQSVLYVLPMIFDLIIGIVYLGNTVDFAIGYVIVLCTLATVYTNFKGDQRMGHLHQSLLESSRAENSVLFDIISNWYTVAIHNRGRYERDRYMGTIDASIRSKREYYDSEELYNSLHSVCKRLGFFTALYIAACRSADGSAAVSSVVLLSSYWSSITHPMVALSWAYRDLLRTFISAEWLHQLLQTEPSVRDKPGVGPLSIPSGRVEFKNVSFSYQPERQILNDVSFVAEPGQSIALVGETGSGKSTILKLLWRFYDVTGGSITIDGQDHRDVTLFSLRESLGIVPQELSVFNQTIMENLKYARDGATDAEVYAVCKAARIHDQIMSFPYGYDSRVGERGVRLSSGELQRVAIARVLLREPPIVVLDEATSSVDSDTEVNVQLALKALSKGRTVFTVAHRLSTIVSADVILVIDKGTIVERGAHDELVKAGGKYAKLWAIQTRSSQRKY